MQLAAEQLLNSSIKMQKRSCMMQLAAEQPLRSCKAACCWAAPEQYTEMQKEVVKQLIKALGKSRKAAIAAKQLIKNTSQKKPQIFI